jgi:hypothetical protein
MEGGCRIVENRLTKVSVVSAVGQENAKYSIP